MLPFLSNVLIQGMVQYGGVGAPVLYPASFYDSTDVIESGKGASEISITPNSRHVSSSPIHLSSGFGLGSC
jgi:hypothetical protein